MLDTLQTTIDGLLDEITNRSKGPNVWTDEQLMKSLMIDTLTLLFFMAHRLDELPTSFDHCRDEATVAFELARQV
jgi:hypothetical protein